MVLINTRVKVTDRLRRIRFDDVSNWATLGILSPTQYCTWPGWAHLLAIHRDTYTSFVGIVKKCENRVNKVRFAQICGRCADTTVVSTGGRSGVVSDVVARARSCTCCGNNDQRRARAIYPFSLWTDNQMVDMPDRATRSPDDAVLAHRTLSHK